MALALLLQQRAEKNKKPGKGENFGCKFKANFALESSKVRPFGKLSGQLIIESPTPILHYGIRVQYEALCTLKFESKLDNRVKCHCKCGNLLEGGEDKDIIDGYMESPVMVDLERIIKDESNNRPYELQAGVNTYGFNITVPGEMLPAPFKNAYGTLAYKLVAYMRSDSGAIVQIGEKTLRFSGYYNLSLNSNISRGILLERSVKKSIFTGKKLVIVKLSMDNRGFLPDEQLRFTMTVQNPKCLPYKASVLLIQKVVYSINNTKKTTVAVIGSVENDVTEPELETEWDGAFKIHKMSSPTYKGQIGGMYFVSHVVQFKLKLDDYNVIKAEHTVFVGTTRESEDAIIASVNNLDLGDGSSVAKTSERRRSSVASNLSTSSVTATTSSGKRPPLLAQLSSAQKSFEGLASFEDLSRDENQDTVSKSDSNREPYTDLNRNTTTLP